MRSSVSLCMIVKDEAGTLGRCLESVAGLVAEAVVVDTGSRDGTREVAIRHGARVVDLPWPDSFAAARNASLDHARSPWAFWLDADEWLDEDGRSRLLALFERLGDENAVYFMRQSSPLGEPGAGTLTVAQPRLFRNEPNVRWRYRVHEQILPACLAAGARALATDVVIRHSGYESPSLCVRKQERNLRLLEQERAENPDDPWVLYQLGKFAAERPDGLEEARGLLFQSHQILSRGHDPLKRQVHAALGTTLRRLGLASEAAKILREGLNLYPNDATLLSESGLLAFESGDLARAEVTFTTLLKGPADPDELFGAVDLSLRGWQARHFLASVHRRQGRPADAEAQWRAALREKPDAAAAWLGLCELYLAQERWGEFADVVNCLRQHASGSPDVHPDEAALLQARAHLARDEFADARAALAPLLLQKPARDARPLLLLGMAYLHEGDDLEAAGKAFRGALALDPTNAVARRGLEALAGGEQGDGPAAKARP